MTDEKLASSAKSLHWTLGKDPLPPYSHIIPQLIQHPHPLVAETAEFISNSHQNPVMPVEIGDAYLTLTLLHSPNLQRLCINNVHTYGTKHPIPRWHRSIQHNVPQSFQNLKILDITNSLTRFQDLVHILHLPSLKTLSVRGMTDKLSTCWDIPPASLQLEELSLLSCRLHSLNIAEVISGCRQLQKFACSKYVSLEDFRRNRDGNVFSRIKTALDRHASSLQEVHLSCFQPWGNEWYPHGPASIRSFTSYTRLTRLCILHDLPVKEKHEERLVEHLPPNLKTLILTRCKNNLRGAIQPLIEHKETLVNLESIIITGDTYKESYSAFQKCSDLIERFAEVGIKFEHDGSLQKGVL
jgi:hypothetical protein